MGNFLSELMTGKRVPTNVIAKNPMLQSPSYTGKAFFGEGANSLSNVDVDQLFNKAIAVFPKMSGGSGTSSFKMQNFGSFSKAMSLTNFVSQFMTGSSNISSTRKLNQVMGVVNKINDMTGSRADEMVEIFRADNALPIMTAISTHLSGFEKSIISASSFQNGWIGAQGVGNMLLQQDPGFMEVARKLL